MCVYYIWLHFTYLCIFQKIKHSLFTYTVYILIYFGMYTLHMGVSGGMSKKKVCPVAFCSFSQQGSQSASGTVLVVACFLSAPRLGRRSSSALNFYSAPWLFCRRLCEKTAAIGRCGFGLSIGIVQNAVAQTVLFIHGAGSAPCIKSYRCPR